MTAIWRNDGTAWRLLAPVGFPDESSLHTLVEGDPQLLPLAGNPHLTILGREVALGNGIADLVAVEPSGRLVVIEVKLTRNPEARRAVVAQVLTYAAFLRGLSRESLERNVLAPHLSRLGHTTLADAVSNNYQEGTLDISEFEQGLAQSLLEGRFRLVLVLDDAPDELVRLVGYLAAIADKVLIDLVTVSAYQVGDSQILVPQRVDPEYQPGEPAAAAVERASKGRLVDGADDFAVVVKSARPEHSQTLTDMYDWAKSLEEKGLVRLSTYHAKNGATTLLPRLRADNVGLVTIYSDNTGGSLQFWRTVFERHAPAALELVEQALGSPVKQGNTTRNISDGLLSAISRAYAEAAEGRVGYEPSKGEPTIKRLIHAGLVRPGDALVYDVRKAAEHVIDLGDSQFHAQFGDQLEVERNVIWKEDGESYALSPLTWRLRDAHGSALHQGALNGYKYWCLATAPGESLFELAEQLQPEPRVPL